MHSAMTLSKIISHSGHAATSFIVVVVIRETNAFRFEFDVIDELSIEYMQMKLDASDPLTTTSLFNESILRSYNKMAVPHCELDRVFSFESEPSRKTEDDRVERFVLSTSTETNPR